MYFKISTKENVSNYFAYVLPGIGKHLSILQRVKAHAIRREPSTLLLYARCEILPISGRARIKADASTCMFCFLS